LLADGPQLCSKVITEAQVAGVSRPRLYRVAKMLGIRRSAKGYNTKSYWCLPNQQTPERRSAYAKAITFLTSLLAKGPLRAEEVLQQAKQNGISRGQAYRAMAASSGAIRASRSYPYWHLPGQAVPRKSDTASTSPGSTGDLLGHAEKDQQ